MQQKDSCHLPAKQQRMLLVLSDNEQPMCHCLVQTIEAIPHLHHPYCQTALESASVDVVTACKYAHAISSKPRNEGLSWRKQRLPTCMTACWRVGST